MFHAGNNLYFGRNEDDSVTIIKSNSIDSSSAPIFNVNIPSDIWCSIIASVSKDGENAATFSFANSLHNGSRNVIS